DELKIKKDNSFSYRYRRSLRQLITESLPKQLSGLESAILYGDTSGINRTMKNNFQRSGIYHLFAVSGLNLTLTVAFIFFVARWLNSPPLVRLALGLSSVFFYLWLVGYSASVSRAAIMIIVVLFSWYAARRLELVNALSLAALILLIINPYQLYDVAFQLSFGAVIGILFLTPVLTKVFKPELKRLVMPVAVALGAQLAVEPILAFYFNQLSVISVIANVVLVPPVAAITGSGFLATLMALVSRPLARVIFKITMPLLSYLNFGAAFFAALPGASMALPRPGAVIIISYFLILLAALFSMSRLKRKLGFGVFVISLLAIIMVGIWSQVPASMSSARLTVSFLDVGQGDAILIRGPRNHIILVDGGVSYQLLKKKLALKAVRKIDLMILSHAHADHVSGLVGVLEDYPVGMVLDPGYPHTSPIYKDFLKVIKRKKIRYKIGRRGQIYRLGRIKLRLFRPSNYFITGSNSDVNNSSIVARLTYGNFHLLLPGDIERESITELLREREDISADVLKVSHHGSYTGTTMKLLRAVRPREAIISVGKDNLYGHPHRQALRRLRAAGSRIWRTDINGDIELSSDGASYNIRSSK
ncbi:MAG TPA: DNA internalization-related competence protein ComEC/Rec2, partial [Actinobacteria bacterium]|nr:DNA internalization-related competence protein ComEC/Rec2 [Actinomycetes bacterium]HEX21250.1 DNA internalization-related competence protein ComEC/Rec2 [Actinomycetota bacterium]